jgi:hypothetical protein
MASMYAPPPARPRRRARWPWVLLGVVLVLAALFVAADRIALHIAEDKAAETLQSSQHLNTKPDVSVAGFPFLTQLATGEFDEVTISASNLDVGNDTVQIASLVVHLHHVTVPRDYSQVRARTAVADARIGYDELSRALHVQVTDAGGGRLSAKPTVTVAGQTFSGTVSAVPRTSGNTIRFADPKVGVGSVNLPAVAVHALADVFSKAISLAGLPFNVQVTGASVATDGLAVQLTGHNLVYSRS